MNTALQVARPFEVERDAPAARPHFTLGEMQQMAKTIAASRLFPGIEGEQSALALMLLCDSEGLHPMQAMRRFHIVKGRPTMRADAMQAEFQRQGGVIRWVRSDPEACEARFFHPVHAPDPGVPVSFTMDDAKAAGLLANDTWRKYPAPMLRARVISAGVRMVLPGVVVGIYTPEEAEAFDDRPEPRPGRREPARPLPPPREDGPAAEATAAPAPAAEPQAPPSPGRAPRTGRELFGWAKRREQETQVGLLKYLNSWSKLQDWPGRMVDWDAEQVALAHAEALRKLESVAGPAPEPEPRAPLYSEADDADPAGRQPGEEG